MSLFSVQLSQYQERIEHALPLFLPSQGLSEGGSVVEAARYSLLGGGKRIRPVLLLAVCDMLGTDLDKAMPFACALEMIHTYSLVHDDLPCMDDDDLRRGRPTCHKAYGVAMAVLAGDTLLNRAYEIMLAAVSPDDAGSVEAARAVAGAAGSRGMIGGQALDLAALGQIISYDQLTLLHEMKTGALLKAPVMAAIALSGCQAAIKDSLDRYADAIGLAFQIQDDILDATADSQTLGKSAGKDVRDDKPTYVSLLGLKEAGRHLAETIDKAREAANELDRAGFNSNFLVGLADYLLLRAR